MKHFIFLGFCLLQLNFINAQNVGINKTNPLYPLDVHGIINTDSAYYNFGWPVLRVDAHDNSFIGKFAGAIGVNIQGDKNTIVGTGAGGVITTLQSGNTAVGNIATTANCNDAVAIGNSATANFDNSIAIGSWTVTPAANTIRLGNTSISGIYANVGLTVTSDKNKKEKIYKVNQEDILQKLAAIPLSSWNLKGQDSKKFRHYGPMAQDFYAAFGKDKYGSIGNDTTINSEDLQGINMIAIQALEKRTTILKEENEKLEKQLSGVTALEKENSELKQSVAELKVNFEEQQKSLSKRITQLEFLVIKSTRKEKMAVK